MIEIDRGVVRACTWALAVLLETGPTNLRAWKKMRIRVPLWVLEQAPAMLWGKGNSTCRD